MVGNMRITSIIRIGINSSITSNYNTLNSSISTKLNTNNAIRYSLLGQYTQKTLILYFSGVANGIAWVCHSGGTANTAFFVSQNNSSQSGIQTFGSTGASVTKNNNKQYTITIASGNYPYYFIHAILKDNVYISSTS